MLNELSKQIHENNKAKGFYDEEKKVVVGSAPYHDWTSHPCDAFRYMAIARELGAADDADDFEDGLPEGHRPMNTANEILGELR